MYIKIYKKSQMILLRNVSGLFKKKYKIPSEILSCADTILETKKLGKTGFIAIILHALQDDTLEMQDVINYYPHRLKIKGDIIDIPIAEQQTWLTDEREWYLDTWKVKNEDSFIYIIYSMTLQKLYGEGQK